MSSACQSTFSLALATLTLTLLSSCSTSSGGASALFSDPVDQGLIDYPFAEETRPLGQNTNNDRFILRSTVGNTEYAVEIPDSARNYEFSVPLADLGGGTGGPRNSAKQVSNPVATDKELKSTMPNLNTADERGLVEGAFGVGQIDGPNQSPSFVYGIAKVNEYYLKREFEYGLVEVNNLLTYYPTSAKLFKMKGTLLMKMRSLKLAEVAWTRAAELAPEDQALQSGLVNLRNRLQYELDMTKIQNASLNR